jgi:hypothetical protein
MTDTGSLSIETTSTFSLGNTSEMNVPDFYVFCPPERANEQGHQNYGHLSSITSLKRQEIDFDRVKKYIMTTIQISPYKKLVLKQALKVI